MLPPTSVTRAVRRLDEPVDQVVELLGVDRVRQRQRQQRQARRGAHGRDVADVDGQRLVADVARRAEAAIEVHALDQRVGGQDLERAAFGRRHRRVVADADDQGGGAAGQAARGCDR